MHNPVKFDASGTYNIIVQGSLPERLYPYFANLKIVTEKDKNDISNTLLTGNVKDQAALAGILNMLYEFHYPILLVEYLTEKITDAETLENGSAS